MPPSRIAWGWIALLFLACAGPQLPAWRPDPGEELRKTCAPSPSRCRTQAESLATRWNEADKDRNDDDAFQALQLFAAACQLGDRPACDALESRFVPPRNWGQKFEALPVPRSQGSPAPIAGHWAATCLFLRSGTPSACRVDQSLPGADDVLLERVRTGSWSPAMLDGRAFRCWNRIEATFRPQ